MFVKQWTQICNQTSSNNFFYRSTCCYCIHHSPTSPSVRDTSNITKHGIPSLSPPTVFPVLIILPVIFFPPTSAMVNKTTASGQRYAVPKKKTKTNRKEMTDMEKGMIIAFFHCLGSIIQVARIIGRPWSTVKSVLLRACEHLPFDNLP